jgi:daunorubicin/doxorubicin transport system permease protein
MTTTPGVDAPLGAVLSTRARPPRPSALSASRTFGWRALLKLRHVPEQLIDVIGLPVIFTLGFTYLFGGALAGSPRAYLHLLLPGTLAMTVILVTTGVFDRFRSLPIWRPAPIVGAVLGDVGRYLLASALVIALALLLGYRPGGGVVGVLAAVALVLGFAFGLSWVWTTLGLVLRAPGAVNNLSLLVLFPLTLASNIFVDPRPCRAGCRPSSTSTRSPTWSPPHAA